MSGAILPTRLADLARGDLASLRAFLSGRRTRGTSLAAQLDARHDTEKQDTLLTWAARHGQAEAVRLLLEAGASVGDDRVTTDWPRRFRSTPRVPVEPRRVRPAAPRGQCGGQPSR